MSTPKGRKKYQDMLRNSASPSPSRGAQMRSSPFLAKLAQTNNDEDDDDDDDEETLQLKLQEIQAKLKLKKLQSAKAKGTASTSSPFGEPLLSSDTKSRPNITNAVNLSHRDTHQQVEVPASPVRRAQAPITDQSPTRVRLGIDKGLTAEDVSLKRAPSYKRLNGSPLGKRTLDRFAPVQPAQPKPISFNERLANMRNDEVSRKERQAKIQKLRSNTFNIGQDEMDSYKNTAVDIPEEPARAPVFSREQILHGTGAGISRSQTTPALSSTNSGAGEKPSEDAASFEAYSCLHLSRRILPHNVLTRHVSGKKIFNIKDLLREVKSPDYSLPDIEQDIVVFGIMAKKSEPRSHQPKNDKSKKVDDERGKFMIMTLVDLDFEVDLFLFDTGFTRFWKLVEGTVIAILNPNIMPPPPGRADTGKFSLVINSDCDTILEIGKARDLGYCQSTKKDGELCKAWVNRKKTEFCEYHSNEAIKKQKSTRIEMNSSGFGHRQGTNSRGGFRGNGRFGNSFGESHESSRNKNYDWESRSQFFAARSMSAADLLDGKDLGMTDRKERKEFLKRKTEAQERERDIMKKLGQVGSSAGRDYMKQTGSRLTNMPVPGTQSTMSESTGDTELASRNAEILELARGERAIHLSPVKRKRPESSDAGSSVTSATRSNTSAAYGWGSNLRDKLSSMKQGEKFIQKEDVPLRKKTRFVTEKGIRVAGRESLGNELSERQITFDDDDDDDLFIVK